MNTLWQPSATIENLKKRAQIMATIRQFFAERGVWEVETPVLSQASITDVQLRFMATQTQGAAGQRRLFLHTSPEFPMKRLVCAGSGSIYQLGKVFRDDECGRHHNPEFTLLEWYRIGFDHLQLMDEMEALLQRVLGYRGAAQRLRYNDAFRDYIGVDAVDASDAQLAQLCRDRGHYHGDDLPRDAMLQLLFSLLIEPHLGQDLPCFIYDYPASQAALARVRQEHPPVASRFEVYVRGMELANGFHELSVVAEQRQRFENDNRERQMMGIESGVIDEALLAALAHGLPDCAGVALGVDRLMMLALNVDHIDDVISFPIARA